MHLTLVARLLAAATVRLPAAAPSGSPISVESHGTVFWIAPGGRCSCSPAAAPRPTACIHETALALVADPTITAHWFAGAPLRARTNATEMARTARLEHQALPAAADWVASIEADIGSIAQRQGPTPRHRPPDSVAGLVRHPGCTPETVARLLSLRPASAQMEGEILRAVAGDPRWRAVPLVQWRFREYVGGQWLHDMHECLPLLAPMLAAGDDGQTVTLLTVLLQRLESGYIAEPSLTGQLDDPSVVARLQALPATALAALLAKAPRAGRTLLIRRLGRRADPRR